MSGGDTSISDTETPECDSASTVDMQCPVDVRRSGPTVAHKEWLHSGTPAPGRSSQVRDNQKMATIVRTSRVVLREFSASDLDVVAELMADEDQMTLYPRPRSRDEAAEWLNRHIALYQEHGYGVWLMEDITNRHFLGYSGFRPRMIEGLEEVEMVWHTHKLFWNQGLATESVQACQALAFARFGISRLVAVIDPVNAPSHRVAQKVGMRVEREIVLDDWPCVVYSAERPALAAFATIVDDQDRVLLIRRRDLDIWECPGGAAEDEELAADVVVRETREETGLHIAAGGIGGLYWRPARETLVVQFVCEVIDGSAQPTEEAGETRYFERDRLPHLTAPVVRERIEDSLSSPAIFRTQEGLGAKDFLASLD